MKIVISGASSGIGYELVKLFCELGHEVFAFARSSDKLMKLEKECAELSNTVKLNTYAFDLSEFDTYSKLIGEIQNRLAHVDILINNAGRLVNKEFKDCDLDDFGKSFSVNVKAPFYLINQLLPTFSKNAHIVNIGSMGGFQGSTKFPGLSLYSSSKAALAVLSECLAEELKSDGIKVNCLALGATQTEMLEKAFPEYKAPLSANEMANFIVDFALNGHKYFNGKVLPISLSTP